MKKILLCCCILVLFAGCVTSGGARHVSYPNQVTNEIQAKFNAAEDLYMNRSFAAADSAFLKFISENPYTQLTDEARFLRGEIAFIRKDYAAAVKLYRESFSQIASPTIEPKARFKTAYSLYKLGKASEALTELNAINRREASSVLKLRADSLGATLQANSKEGKYSALVWYLRIVDDYSEGATQAKTSVPDEKIVSLSEAQASIKGWVDDKGVTASDVEALPLKEFKGKESGGYAMYKQALCYHTSGDMGRSKDLLKNFISTYPKSEYYGAARLMLGEVGGAVGEASGMAVGLIVPLSGRMGVYGESVLHGVECAVGIYDPCVGPSGLRLLVRDSESFPGGAAGAVNDLARDKDLVAILGPLQSTGAIEAAQAAEQNRVSMISLSQKDGVAEVGDFTFRNSVSTPSEMQTLANYVIHHKGMKRFFALYPNNKKGMEYFRLFSSAVKENGGTISASRSYSPNQLMFSNELRGRGAVEQAQQNTLDLSSVGSSYDAVFIPDAYGVVNSLLQSMALSGSQKVQLLGISRWNDPDLVKKSGDYIEGAIFVDSFYKASSDPEVQGFVSRFRDAYGVEPTLLEALGYDNMRIVESAIQEKGAARRESVKDALKRTTDFAGVSGRTTFDEIGDAKRQMQVLTVSGGEIRAAK